ncbi:dockerin type I domain-containing protein, partial [bacterium]|nr:dockerin type I domain-containing protein [bacterium]
LELVEPPEVIIDFGPDFSPLGLGASASTNTPGIVNEVGSFRTQAFFSPPYSDFDNAELVTIFFNATEPGVIDFKGSPAELSPNHDTLLYGENVPVLTEDIKHDVLRVTISPAGSPLQNQNLNEDVNNDGIVSPIDALLGINFLMLNGEGESARDRAGNFYPDVNGDGIHTAGDVLRTVNFLGKKPGSGEGEQLSVESPVTKSTTDEVFSDIGVSVLTATDKVVVTDCPKAPEVVDSSELNSVSHSPNEDEENGLLDLLADDVERIWN